MLLAMVTLLTASVARRPPAPATGIADPASQDQPKNSATGPANASRRKIPCKTPENASLCYWTHGRLSVYEGWVTFRIWKIGTRRMLGVFSGPSRYPATTDEDAENPEFPPELDKALEANQRRHKRSTGTMWTVTPPVFADFEVCPLRPEEKGVRQPICIESAKNIFVQDDDD
jgi:hypothetical protein